MQLKKTKVTKNKGYFKLSQIKKKLISAVTISKTTENVYAVDDHIITCVLGDIPDKITGVSWLPAEKTDNGYILVDGDINSKTQTSTLTISASKLVTLKSTSASKTFTCKITVGKANTPKTATQTITIYNPSENILQLIDLSSSFQIG